MFVFSFAIFAFAAVSAAVSAYVSANAFAAVSANAFAAVSANVFANAFVIVALAVASGAMNLPYLDSC